MPSGFFKIKANTIFLNEFIRIVGNAEMMETGGVLRNEVIGGALKP